MNPTVEKFLTLWPEIALLVGAVVCLFAGLSPSRQVRGLAVWVAAASLVIAGGLVPFMEPDAHAVIGLSGVAAYVKLAVVGVGLILLLIAANVPGQVQQNRDAEAAPRFDPGLVLRGEFYAFFLVSLAGVMLTAGASDLVWLFLALELTSLPTYVMVAIARDRLFAQEAAVKYFFLGAMSAAVFLYGFTLIYGATGFTTFTGIARVIMEQLASGQLSPLLTLGLVLSIVGICFKIAAFPMHFYAADVYQGANTAVTAFLAFVPKTAGFVALILLLGLIGWPNRLGDFELRSIEVLLWGIAAITMTVGNVLALVQNNVKRVLAYSSIAHSGYILVGLLAGRSLVAIDPLGDGTAGALFYIIAYGLGTIAAFGVLGCLTSRGEEAQTYDDLRGLKHRHPLLAAIMLISMLSLLGMPPLVGFLGKIYLFVPAYQAGYVVLVVIALLNSAVSAAYYLRIASVCYFGVAPEHVERVPGPARVWGAGIAAVASIALGLAGGWLVNAAHQATETGVPASTTRPIEAAADPDAPNL